MITRSSAEHVTRETAEPVKDWLYVTPLIAETRQQADIDVLGRLGASPPGDGQAADDAEAPLTLLHEPLDLQGRLKQ